jgi:dienelactone hydrolase
MKRVFAILFAALSDTATSQSISSRDVTIPTTDGAQLSATYYNADRAAPTVVLFRNCDQQRASVDPFARRLAGRGVHVIAYDYRPGNRPQAKTSRGARTDDATDVLRWLSAQRGVDSTRVVALGGSCGSTVAIDMAAAHTQAVRGIVMLSLGPADSGMKAFLARTPAVALLAGAAAPEGSEQNLRPLVSASTNPASRMVVVPTGHGTEMLKESPAFEKTVIDWILARLRS